MDHHGISSLHSYPPRNHSSKSKFKHNPAMIQLYNHQKSSTRFQPFTSTRGSSAHPAAVASHPGDASVPYAAPRGTSPPPRLRKGHCCGARGTTDEAWGPGHGEGYTEPVLFLLSPEPNPSDSCLVRSGEIIYRSFEEFKKRA